MNIVNLKTSVDGMELVSTTKLVDIYAEHLQLTDKQQEQIENLGVNSRYFFRNREDYTDPAMTYGERHRIILKNIGTKVLNNCSYKPHHIIVASEIADYQTPGLASILCRELGLSKWSKCFNLQGTACSSMPRILELAKVLPGNSLCLIDGCTSDIYQTELAKLEGPIKPYSSNWVKLMFGFLFGDAVAGFMVVKEEAYTGYRFKDQYHVVNLDKDDYRQAAVKRENGFYLSAASNITDKALAYCDTVLARAGIEDLYGYKRVFLHTGSKKIIDAFVDRYELNYEQIANSELTLRDYGNTTGCSIPLVINRDKNIGKSLIISISMGFGLDIMEIDNSPTYKSGLEEPFVFDIGANNSSGNLDAATLACQCSTPLMQGFQPVQIVK